MNINILIVNRINYFEIWMNNHLSIFQRSTTKHNGSTGSIYGRVFNKEIDLSILERSFFAANNPNLPLQ